MKKFFTTALIATLAIASCTTIEDVQMPAVQQVENHEIAFRATAAGSVKAASSEAVIAENEMSVAAYNVTSSSDYFTGTSFNKGASHYAGGKYWPNSISYINFLAYAGAEDAVFESAGQFTVEVADNKDAQNDYFYAIGHGEVSQSAGSLSFPSDVELSFSRALALVNFAVEGLEIESITLTGASFGGTLTVKENNFNAKNGQAVSASWTNVTPAESAIVPAQGLKVIPQAMGASGFKVAYTVNGKAASFTYFFSADEKNYEAGMSYTYTLSSSENGIAVCASAQAWN